MYICFEESNQVAYGVGSGDNDGVVVAQGAVNVPTVPAGRDGGGHLLVVVAGVTRVGLEVVVELHALDVVRPYPSSQMSAYYICYVMFLHLSNTHDKLP